MHHRLDSERARLLNCLREVRFTHLSLGLELSQSLETSLETHNVRYIYQVNEDRDKVCSAMQLTARMLVISYC